MEKSKKKTSLGDAVAGLFGLLIVGLVVISIMEAVGVSFGLLLVVKVGFVAYFAFGLIGNTKWASVTAGIVSLLWII